MSLISRIYVLGLLAFLVSIPLYVYASREFVVASLLIAILLTGVAIVATGWENSRYGAKTDCGGE